MPGGKRRTTVAVRPPKRARSAVFPIEELPLDLLAYVFTFKDKWWKLRTGMLVCKRWKEAVKRAYILEERIRVMVTYVYENSQRHLDIFVFSPGRIALEDALTRCNKQIHTFMNIMAMSEFPAVRARLCNARADPELEIYVREDLWKYAKEEDVEDIKEIHIYRDMIRPLFAEYGEPGTLMGGPEINGIHDIQRPVQRMLFFAND